MSFIERLLMIFPLFCCKHTFWVLTNTHKLCYWAKIGTIMYIPVNPTFPNIKWGFPGCLFRRLNNLTMDRLSWEIYSKRHPRSIFRTKTKRKYNKLSNEKWNFQSQKASIILHRYVILMHYSCVSLKNTAQNPLCIQSP